MLVVFHVDGGGLLEVEKGGRRRAKQGRKVGLSSPEKRGASLGQDI